jgi:hypothetical protein
MMSPIEFRAFALSCLFATGLSACASAPSSEAKYLQVVRPWGGGAIDSQLEFSNARDCRMVLEAFLKEPFNVRSNVASEQTFKCSSDPVVLAVHAVYQDDSGALVKASFSSVNACEFATRNSADRLRQACAVR